MPARRVQFEVQEAVGCPLFETGDKMVVALPGVDREESSALCAATIAAAFPLIQSLSHGVPFEKVGEGQGDQGVFYCPGGVGRRVVFTVTLGEEVAPAPAKEPSLTVMIQKKDRDRDVDFIIGHLKRIDLFKPLPEPSLETMIPALELKRFAEGTPIIQQGAPGEHLYIIIKGTVDVVQKSEEGLENTLATLSKGEVFGEMSLISGEACSATVRSSSHVSALVISKENFHAILAENPSLNIYFNKLLVQRLRRQNVQVDEEISRGVLGKLSMITLPELAQTINMNNRTGTLILYNASLRGEIYFREGQAVDASLGDLAAEEAFYALLAWSDGNFRFKPGEIERDRAIKMDTMGLLMEGLRRLDEAARIPS